MTFALLKTLSPITYVEPDTALAKVLGDRLLYLLKLKMYIFLKEIIIWVSPKGRVGIWWYFP